jgi:hypothetical protein
VQRSSVTAMSSPICTCGVLGPGHLGAVLSVVTGEPRDCKFYRARLGHLKNLSHVTIEVTKSTA